MPSVEERLTTIEARNSRVELEKAWEVSLLRRGFIATITYAVVGITLMLTNMPHPWVNAVIPALGYVLSTLTLPVLRRFWHNHRASSTKGSHEH